jgi:hypothetical protein
MTGNSVHRARDVTFAQEAHQPRTAHAPAILAGPRDIVRGALHKTGRANNAAGRRTHLDPISVPAPHGIP